MKKYNLQKLIKVKVVGFTKHMRWHWQEEKRVLGLKTRKAGWVHIYDSLNLTDPRPYDYNFGRWADVQGKDLFIKPKVVFLFQDDHEVVRYFNSKNDAIEYANQMIEYSKLPFVEFIKQ